MDNISVSLEIPEAVKFRELIEKHEQLMRDLSDNLWEMQQIRLQLECKVGSHVEGTQE